MSYLWSAGKAHDVMALKCRGPGSPLNFGLEEYEELLPMLPNLSKVWSTYCQLLFVDVWPVYFYMPWYHHLAFHQPVLYPHPGAGWSAWRSQILHVSAGSAEFNRQCLLT